MSLPRTSRRLIGWTRKINGKTLSQEIAEAADAREGLAKATFTPSQVDSTYVLLTITYADGEQESTGMMNMIAMGGSSAWRMAIGTG